MRLRSACIAALHVACGGNLATGGSGAGAGGTGGGDAGSVVEPSGPPRITILSPTPGEQLVAAWTAPGGDASEAHLEVPLRFQVSGFTLDPSCGSDAACGNVVETTDGVMCNAKGANSNNVFGVVAPPDTSATGSVWLDLCTTPLPGTHVTKLELHRADGSLYTCGGACPEGISGEVSYTVTGVLPLLTITSPAPGATLVPVEGVAHITVPVTFSVAGFTLETSALSGCGGQFLADCGQVNESTDGHACDRAPLLYNQGFFGSDPPNGQGSGNVWLDLCPSVAGPHVTTLELRNIDHSLYTCSGACPQGISASIAYTVAPIGDAGAD